MLNATSHAFRCHPASRGILAVVLLFIFNSLGSAAVAQATQRAAVTFVEGFLAEIGTNAQDAENGTIFSDIGIDRAIFYQDTASGQFEESPQGNDIPGTLRLIFDGEAIDLPALMVWRWKTSNGGSVPWSFGVHLQSTVNETVTISSTTYTLTGGSSSGKTNIGLVAPGTTGYTFGTFASANAATGQVLVALNEELATAQSS